MEKEIFIYPNDSGFTDCLFMGDKEEALNAGYIAISEEQLRGLKNRELCWMDKQLVPYEKTEADIAKETLKQKREVTQNEIREIQAWFAEYDNQIKQYERCVRLGIAYDNKLGTIEELDAQAAEKAMRLSQLRNGA